MARFVNDVAVMSIAKMIVGFSLEVGMYKRIVAIAVLIVCSVASAKSAEIAPDALLERARKADESFVIVDVRTPAEFAQGHVPGAINIPVDQVAKRVGELANAKEKD